MSKTPAIVICFGLIGAGAVVHGATTHRWAVFSTSSTRTADLHALEVRCGDFRSEEIPNDLPLKEKSTATSRSYVSPSRQLSASITLISGPAGSVSTHTPDVCYPASGYKTARPPRRETIDLPEGGQASYYVAEFEKRTATRTERYRVRWAWTSDGIWVAPDRARFAFLRVPELFKLYIVTPVPEAARDRQAEDPPAVRQFVAASFAQYSGLFAGR
jgi:hypothetical protein